MMTDKAYDVILNTLTPETTRDDVTLPDLDRKPDPWESSMQATAECLSWRGAWDNLDRRHTEDQLGETVYRDFPRPLPVRRRHRSRVDGQGRHQPGRTPGEDGGSAGTVQPSVAGRTQDSSAASSVISTPVSALLTGHDSLAA